MLKTKKSMRVRLCVKTISRLRVKDQMETTKFVRVIPALGKKLHEECELTGV